MLTSGRTCTPTPSCPEAPPCTPVLLAACRRRSPPPQRGSSPSGSEAPSWLRSPPSSRCGSPSRSTTSAAPPSSTASASKRIPTFEEEKQQHTGSYRHHLHLLVSGVFPFSLFNHTSFGRLTSFSSIRLSITFLLQL